MSVQDPITFRLFDLTRSIAQEAMGDDFYRWYRDFGAVEGFINQEYLIRPGVTLNTEHQVFIMDRSTGHRVSVDSYGDVGIYAPLNPTIHRLAAFVADAKATIISREEPLFTEATDHIFIPDLSVRMAL